MIVFSGAYYYALAQNFAKLLGAPLGQIEYKVFPDQEIFVSLTSNVHHKDVLIIQSLQPSVHDRIMELLLMVNAAWRGGAKTIRAIVPYLAYGRPDRGSTPGASVPAEVLASLFNTCKLDQLITFDMHSQVFETFFPGSFLKLSALTLFADNIQRRYNHPVLIAPDQGAREKVQALGKILKAEIAYISKERSHQGTVRALEFIGNVKHHTCIIVDDMVDSGGTLIMAATLLKEKGAADIHAYVTHGVLSGSALLKLHTSPLSSLTVTDTLPFREEMKGFCQQVSVIPLLKNMFQNKTGDCAWI